jgi:hypothetical protein
MISRAAILSYLVLTINLTLVSTCSQPARSSDQYGPVNLLKTIPTPFGPSLSTGADKNTNSDLVQPISIRGSRHPASRRPSLKDRLMQSRLYLPGRMVLGKPAEFTVMGRPGSHVALAMADRDNGAKAIYGHSIRLGPDRKVVSLGTIPDSGVLKLFIETPIQGDLIGQNWYFEAAIWNQPDFSDVQLATTVTSTGENADFNGVLVSKDNEEKKRGLKFTATPASTFYETENLGLSKGRP